MALRASFSTVRSFCARPTQLISPLLVPNPRAFSCKLAPVSGVRSQSHHNNFGARKDDSTAAIEEKIMSKKIFDTEEDLAASLAKYTADLSFKFSEQRGSFCLVLSGGSLVKSLRKLVEPPYIDSVEWSRWRVFWVDERVIPKDHDDCNYKLAYDCFLSQVPILSGNVYAINEALEAEHAADDYETCLRHLVKCGVIDVSAATGLPKFDLMLMNMDCNGHIASEFARLPFSQEDNGKWVTFIKESPKLPIDTVTLTFPVINSSAHMAIVATVESKASSQHISVEGCQDSTDEMPFHLVSPLGKATWFLIR